MSEKGKPFVVSGPSGAGKTTVIKKALEVAPVHLSISATTRRKRRGEVSGVDYVFMSEDEFKRLVDDGAFFEWAEVYGNFYGTLKSQVESVLERGEDVLLELDVVGALTVKRKAPEARLIFIMPSREELLTDRLEGRETDNKNEISARLKVAPRELEVGVRDFDDIIVNDNLDEAVLKLVMILREEKV
ncbi:MAG: guanylate kinase [Candidatus Anoxymicrobium japonicum]|uniref:Guanylate kinase n=1 Tax=Candidatus Anoxymicrobium japonicum TaxID=2013648 RepID=A0A2N3G4W8_9ACTN|nr:MAG: guanylate kinase [Candidatus Anoxymicrobium japonicum]